jgi:hypothetical protein
MSRPVSSRTSRRSPSWMVSPGHLYPGEMDRYADRLNEAAGMTDAAKKRPDGTGDEIGPEGSTR